MRLKINYVVSGAIRWAPYRAAKTALDNVLQQGHIATLNTRNMVRALPPATYRLKQEF
jgi:hypothetical protein